METPQRYLEGSAAQSTPQGSIALDFARALVAGEYEAAHAMLASSLQATMSATQLQAEFERMIDYFDSPLRPVEFVMTMDMDEWSDKQPTDVGWAYASIEDEHHVEAVSVTVTHEQGKNMIREIMWGRP